MEEFEEFNIRVFSYVRQDGASGFEVRAPHQSGTIDETIELSALTAKRKIEYEQVAKGKYNIVVSIDFKPFHDVEYSGNGPWPIFYSPLTEDEKKEFWKSLNS